jgi:hypothetical protein
LPKIDKRETDMSEAMVSIRRDGTIKFDRKASTAFRRRGIQCTSFTDERTGRSTGRWLTSAERRALGEKPRPCPPPGEVKNFGGFLREIGIRTRKNGRYRARWLSSASDNLIVRIK